MLIEDILGPGLDVVFCGTALGKASFAARAYYAHPRNRFWPTLHEMGLTLGEGPLAPGDYPRVRDFGIGLTDLCKTAAGNDNEIPRAAFAAEDLHRKMALHRPRILAFTSKTGGRIFLGSRAELGWQEPLAHGTRVYVLPSTSPTAQWQWAANKHHWRQLADAVASLRQRRKDCPT